MKLLLWLLVVVVGDVGSVVGGWIMPRCYC